MTLSSRQFGILLAAALFLAPVVNAQTITQAVAAQETYIPEIRLLPASLSPSPSIVMTYVEKDNQPGGGRYFCGGMSQSHASEAARDVSRAFGNLSSGMWDRITLKYVLLCSEAKANGRSIGGIPVPPIKLLMLSAGNAGSASSRLPMTALHELFHLIEIQQNSYNDTSWNASFSGYQNRYDRNDVTVGSAGKGFINAYGASFPHEERAEIFANLLLNQPSITQYFANTNDAILRKKVSVVKAKCTSMLGNGAC